MWWWPDIDKVYNSLVHESKELKRRREVLYEGPTAYFRRDLIGFKNLDLFRAADLFTGVIVVQTALFYIVGLPVWCHILYVRACVRAARPRGAVSLMVDTRM
jgi:hypothetical protein